MQEQKVEQEIDITKLSNEFTYRKYMMSRDSVRHLFSKLSVAEYVALQSIEAISGDSAIYGGKAYLTVLFIILCSKIYIKVLNKFSISGLSLFISLNTILMMSFFTWMGRITFFWTFPIFISIYSKFFFRRGENNV